MLVQSVAQLLSGSLEREREVSEDSIYDVEEREIEVSEDSIYDVKEREREVSETVFKMTEG